MSTIDARFNAKRTASERKPKLTSMPQNSQGTTLKISEYFGINTFDFQKASGIPNDVKEEIREVAKSGKHLQKKHAEIIAKAVTQWATSKNATHFCHWFQPLTGSTAEKHDSFLDFDENHLPIEKLSASQLMQGEPDASSFPHGGSRSTFEARGYTAWDITSPMFIMEGTNGKTLCIPTAFISYTGDALDIKTPLLRSITSLDKAATQFLKLTGSPDTQSVISTCGAEQEYFLVDKAFYGLRPDLLMTGRTLFGSPSSRNQQLEDHYFGTIPTRVEAFMHDFEKELYKLGIAAKTRHNEVAPGQFELAPIFTDANLAADQNQLIMATMKKVAEQHDFVALLHEKPFGGINGSGKHINWSMSDNFGNNLLTPGDKPHENHRFLATVAIIIEAVNRHAKMLRASISDPGNDHRLGANEAPPSIISVFLGDTLFSIFESIKSGATFEHKGENYLDIGAQQLAQLLKDNTDRNRTSPFAFTGNKFEFRACGSSKPIGLPLSILNAAVAEVMTESNQYLQSEIQSGKTVAEALTSLTRKWINNSFQVVFNGDGYTDDWVKEAEKRGLPNLKTTADALAVMKDSQITRFLTEQKVYTENELASRYNILMERYNTIRDIEFGTFLHMVEQSIFPVGLNYKKHLLQILRDQKELAVQPGIEAQQFENLNNKLNLLATKVFELRTLRKEYKGLEGEHASHVIAHKALPKMEEVEEICNDLEMMVPDDLWTLPKSYEMLFIR